MAVLLLGSSLWFAAGPKASAATVSKDTLRGACERAGGEFNELENGDYECLLPDGRHVYCVGFLEMCEFIQDVKPTPEEVQPIRRLPAPIRNGNRVLRGP